MADHNVIASMLDQLSQQQSIQTALCIGCDLTEMQSQLNIEWHYFNVSGFLNLPFQQRYDFAILHLAAADIVLSEAQKTQLLVKLRDLMARRILICALSQDKKLLRGLGFTQMLEVVQRNEELSFWQFNILTYKQVPDWLNSKYWANPQHWNKYRW